MHGTISISGEKGMRGGPGEPGRTIYRNKADPPQIAFSVTMDADMPRTVKYRVVKFSIVLSNIGAAYNPETGIFSTPLNGTYMLGFTGVSYHGQVCRLWDSTFSQLGHAKFYFVSQYLDVQKHNQQTS